MVQPPLLRDVRCDTKKHRQFRVFPRLLTRGNVVRVGGELDRQIAHIHRAAIPLQLEAHLLLPYAIFHQRNGSEIVPLLSHPAASFTHHSHFPPAVSMSWFPFCYLGEASKEVIDASSVLDTL